MSELERVEPSDELYADYWEQHLTRTLKPCPGCGNPIEIADYCCEGCEGELW